jgi:hypothetical protein
MSASTGSASTSFLRSPGGAGGVSRPLIVATVVIGFAWTLAAAQLHAPAYWLFAVMIYGLWLLVLAALVASAILGRAKPAGFVVREGVGFVAPARRGFGYLVVCEVLILAFLTGEWIHTWSWRPIRGGTDAAFYGFWAGAGSVVLLLFGGLVAWLVVTALRGGPQILLTPAAVVQEDWWGNRTIPWEALRPGRPLRLTRRRSLTLIVDRPELVVRRGLFRGSTRRPWLNVAYLRVHPWFLADAIWFYFAHPHRRDAIGARAEYERFVRELGDARGRYGGRTADIPLTL